MNLLLDTHILLWWLMDSRRLSARARTAIEQAEMICVSAVSAWEIEAKRSRDLLRAPDDLERTLRSLDFRPLSLTITHAVAAARLPMHHRDPFDRMLIAQATIESLTLVTADPQLAAYGVPILRA